MKTISLTLITFLISMAPYPALSKAPFGTPAAGGGSIGFNAPTGPGYRSGDTAPGGSTGINGPTGPGYKSGGPGAYKSGDTSNGYKSGSTPGKRYGGDTGAAIGVFPKKPVPTPMPAECKPISGCVTKHIAGGNPKEPQYRGPCCMEFKNKVSCVCKFLLSKNAKQINAANGVIRSCNFKNPICIKKPMPATCRPEVKHCVEMHMYRVGASNPTFGSPCCQKFKTSKRCVMAFRNSPEPHLSHAAKGVIAGCHFS